MSEPLVPLAADWIRRLLKEWATIVRDREDELRRIKDVFGDPRLLAETYIEPDCQLVNPADFHEDEAIQALALRVPVRGWLNKFLSREFFEHDGRHVLFVLSDAGMGKSSLLMMLKLTHLTRFWPSGLDFQLLKLGEDTLDQVASISNKSKTVLLLDALDEDRQAWGRIEERLEELLKATKPFRQVLLTCRTQFFPKGGRVPPFEKPGQVAVAGYVCNLIYLAAFSDEQVDAYLRQVYPATVLDRIRKWLLNRDHDLLERSREMLRHMRSLRMRPMLLAYAKDLMDSDLESWNEFKVYEALVARWLWREEREKGAPAQELLWQACQAVAFHMQAAGQRVLTPAELEELLESQPVAQNITAIDVGGRSLLNRTSEGAFRFSHYSIQEFLVAHGLVTRAASRPARKLQATELVVGFLMEAPKEGDTSELWSNLDFEGMESIERVHPKDGSVLVFVPGGEFLLGTVDLKKLLPDGPDEAVEAAKPVHRVILSPYWIGKYPVTNAQYRRFLEANPKQRKPEQWDDNQFNQPEQPVVGVSWQEAMAYCRWAGLDLPSEAQWEAAARGTDQRRYPWGNEDPTPELANFGQNEGRTTPVGSYPAGSGPYGTLDQAGNVWEWCADVFEEDAYRKRDGEKNPVVLGDETDKNAWRVVRGGSWVNRAWCLATAARVGSQARNRDWSLGFRVGSGPEP